MVLAGDSLLEVMVYILNVPGIDTSDLRGGFITSTVLALLMSFGEDFE